LVEPAKWEDPEYDRKEAFIDAVIQVENDRAKKIEFRARMVEIAECMIDTEDGEMREMIVRCDKIVEGREELSVPEMRQFLIRLEKKAKALGAEL
jgi:hypothetical protein